MTDLVASTRLRVLHIVQNLNYGGMERLLFEMIRVADHHRFEHFVLALQFVGRFGQDLHDFAHVSVARPMERWSMLRPRRLAEDIHAIAPDVVHTHSGVWYKATLAARMAGVPRIVHTEHGRALPDPWSSRTLDSFAARRTDAVIAVSATVARLLVPSIMADETRLHVVPNGVDTDRFSPAADRGELTCIAGLMPGDPVIGSIGRLEPIKGYDVAIEALAVLKARWSAKPLPVLVLVGDGSERGRLEKLARERNVADTVRFLGWRDDLRDLTPGFSIFTMSSHSEGTSMSLLEAMSSGLCPVVTDVGGNAAVLGKELAHRLVPKNDPVALATAWSAALSDKHSAVRDGLLARSRVIAEFQLLRAVRKYERIYEGRDS